MADLSEVLGSLMVSLVHARRIADEETAAVAEYYKDHPLLEGLSLPRVRVPELSIDMPVTFDEHTDAKDATLDTPGNIHKALLSELRSTLDHEDILSQTESFQNTFDKEARRALDRVYEQQQAGTGKISREAVVRAVDDALQVSLRKSDQQTELPAEKKQTLAQAIRHRVAAIALKSHSQPSGLKTSAVTSAVKEHASSDSSVRLMITLREEGLEWSGSETRSGSRRNRLQPE